MANLWLKIKIWTKISLFSIVMIFLLIFIIFNMNKPVSIWVWFGKDEFKTSVLMLIVSMLFTGVLGTLLFRMVFRTIKQIRELKQRNSTMQMQKDVAEMRAKAAMLQMKNAVPQGGEASYEGGGKGFEVLPPK